MIDFNLFADKIDEWAELTVLHTLQRTLKNRMYDRLNHFDQDIFLKSVESLIENGTIPSFNVLRAEMVKRIKKTIVAKPEGQKMAKFEGTCVLRNCDFCEYENCAILDEIFQTYTPKLLDPRTHDEAEKIIIESFPYMNFKDKPVRPQSLLVKRNDLGEWENVWPKETQIHSEFINE